MCLKSSIILCSVSGVFVYTIPYVLTSPNNCPSILLCSCVLMFLWARAGAPTPLPPIYSMVAQNFRNPVLTSGSAFLRFSYLRLYTLFVGSILRI